MNFMNLKELYKWAKIEPEIIKAGKYKDIGNSAREMTQEEKLLLSEMTENVHEQFILDIFKVREKRIIDGMEGLRKYAQGQIFSGQGAKERGLVDDIAGLWEAGRKVHAELKLKENFGLKFIKLKKDFELADVLGGIEQSVKDFNYAIKSHSVPMYLAK